MEIFNELQIDREIPELYAKPLENLYKEYIIVGGMPEAVNVKAAANTQAKSYKQFCKKYKAKAGYKLSLKNIAHNDCEGVFTISLPLYLQWNMDRIRKNNVK